MINTSIPLDFLKGAATVNDDIAVLLNLDLVLSNFEIEEIGYNLRGDSLRESMDYDELEEYDLSGKELDSFSSTKVEETDDDFEDEDDEDLFASVSEDTSDLVEDIPKKSIKTKEPKENIDEEEDDEFFDETADEDDEEFIE